MQSNKFFHEFLFWGHLSIFLGSLASSFFLSFPILVGAIAVHQAHIKRYKECIITKYQKKIKSVPNDKTFIQFMVFRLFKKEINIAHNKLIELSAVFFVIMVALIRVL